MNVVYIQKAAMYKTKKQKCLHKDILLCVCRCFPANLREVGETLGTLSIAVDLSQLIQRHAKC